MWYQVVRVGFCVVIEDLRVDYVGSEVEDGRGLVVDVLVARFCDGSDAPLHVLSVELELSFGDVVVVLLDGLGVVWALLVGGGLGGEVKYLDQKRQ